MKILQVIGGVSPEWAGPAAAALGLSSALAHEGHQVTIFTTNISGRGGFGIKPRGVRFLEEPVNVPVSRDGVEIWHFSVDWPSWWVTSRSMARALSGRIETFDVVHIHSVYLFTTSAAAYYARRAKVPYLIVPHGMLDPFRRGRRRLGKALYHWLVERRDLDHAAAIHYTCEGERQSAAELNLRAPAVVIPLGINTENYADLPPRGTFRVGHPEIGDKKCILFLGRISHHKGLDLLATAFGKLVQKRSDVHLVIAGPDTENFGNKVRQWLHESGSLPHTTLVGMLQGREKLAALRDADVWVLPSYSDSFPIAAVEAMVCGLPLIVSNQVHLWPEIQEAGAGLVVGCEVRELLEAITRLVDDENLRVQLGQNARRLAGERFTWDRVVPRLTDAYRKAAKAGTAPPEE